MHFILYKRTLISSIQLLNQSEIQYFTMMSSGIRVGFVVHDQGLKFKIYATPKSPPLKQSQCMQRE